MQIRSLNIATTSPGKLGVDGVSSSFRPATAIKDEPERSAKAEIVLTSEGAEEAAEQLSYDQPSGREGRALMAYQTVATQSRRDELQQMLRVDLYA